MTILRRISPETPTPIPPLLTPGLMAHDLGVPLHRVLHILRTRKHIQPRAVAGNIRLYRSEAVAKVRQELDLQDSHRRGRHG